MALDNARSPAVPTRPGSLSSAAPAEQGVKRIPPADDEGVPARRLLAHDLEHIAWDVDGDEPVPPPD